MSVQDRIINAYIREKVGRVSSIEVKMVKSCLRWFGHVRRRLIETQYGVNQMQDSHIIRCRTRRPRKSLGENIKNNLNL